MIDERTGEEIEPWRRRCATRSSIGYASYPSVMIVWFEEKDLHGWHGRITVWENESTKLCDKHVIDVRNTTPMGRISASIDPASYGALATASMEGAGIAERDLQWATVWAAAILDGRHKTHGTKFCSDIDKRLFQRKQEEKAQLTGGIPILSPKDSKEI